MDLILYSASVSAVVQAIKMLLQKYFPDKIPNEVYVVVALALGVGLSTFLKLTFDNGLIIGFTAMGMYSTVSNGADVTKRAMKDM